MGGAAKTEKAVFRGIGANPQRFDRPCAGLGQAIDHIAGQIEAEVTLPVRWDKEALVLRPRFQKPVAKIRAAFKHACAVCDWDPALAESAEGIPPPIA